ncbi:MAG: hypothetical protein M3Y74_22935 [Chloroflexota bacterium]|nr:hypothetical protein [Chloroflexota bacterium]
MGHVVYRNALRPTGQSISVCIDEPGKQAIISGKGGVHRLGIREDRLSVGLTEAQALMPFAVLRADRRRDGMRVDRAVDVTSWGCPRWAFATGTDGAAYQIAQASSQSGESRSHSALVVHCPPFH